VQESAVGSPDIDAVATTNSEADGKKHELDVLVWNYHDDDVPAAEAAIQLEVKGLTTNSVTAEEFRMDASHSNAYAAWQQMGSPAQPTPEQQSELESAGRLERMQAPHSVEVINGSTSLELKLPRQGVALVRLRWK